MNWNEASQAVRDFRQPCLVLGPDGKPDPRCGIVATELHHVLFSRDKRFKDWLDNPRLNGQPACRNCNSVTKIADNEINALNHLQTLLNSGRGNELIEWLENPPAKFGIGHRHELNFYLEKCRK